MNVKQKQQPLKRCFWVLEENELSVAYHDKEWGKPIHDDYVLFEFLILEGAQAGLSWQTILERREGYKKAFSNFDPHKVSAYGPDDVAKLLMNPGIIRNRLKIESTITNAHQFIKIQKEFGSFDRYIWAFVDFKPVQHSCHSIKEIPNETDISKMISKDLKKRGFKFVGPTIIYAFMQAVGMVNDHTVDCFRYKELTT